MTHITDVNNGSACNCTCPNPLCQQPLIAKNNPLNDKSPHFAHAYGKQCTGAKESELHELSKQIICDNNQIMLPESSLFVYQKGKSEVGIDRYRADVQLTGGEYQLFVEIEVTNSVSVEKEFYLRQSGNRTLVIDLTETPRDIDKEELKELLLNTHRSKRLILPDIKKRFTQEKEDSWLGVIMVLFIAGLFFIPKLIKSYKPKK